MKIIAVIAAICLIVTAAANTAASKANDTGKPALQADTIPTSQKQVKRSKTEIEAAMQADTILIKADSATIVQGLELIGTSDCTTCHRLSGNNSIGPSYEAIAARYKPTRTVLDLLIERTIEGCSGVWSKVPMTPHPNLSPSDAEKMMLFIFYRKIPKQDASL